MRHHFGDLLDRSGDYWTIVPNRERYAYRICDIPEGSPDVAIVTIGKNDEQWQRVLTLPNLEELTLHEPAMEQLAATGALKSVKRLRVTHARPKDIEFVRDMVGLEEVVLEYVSSFGDIAPLCALPNLRSLHVENLRGVSDFGALTGARSLRYLAIHGTLDWQQPIANFDFLRGLARLEVLALWQFKCLAPYPATLPAMDLVKLKRLRLHRRYLAMAEYALLEEGMAGVEGARWGPYERSAPESQVELAANDPRSKIPEDTLRANHPEVKVRYDGRRTVEDPTSCWFEFTGRAAGRVKCSTSTAEARCKEQTDRYDGMKRQARALLEQEGRG